MATGTFYLRPSADVSVDSVITRVPSDTPAYLLINEEVSDGASTRIELDYATIDADTTANAKFSLSGYPKKVIEVTNIYAIVSADGDDYGTKEETYSMIIPSIIVNNTTMYSLLASGGAMWKNMFANDNYEPAECYVYSKTDTTNTSYTTATTEDLCEEINAYISANGMLPNIELNFEMEVAKNGSKKQGYSRISQAYVVLECEYDAGFKMHHKVNNVWRHAMSAYQKQNGAWVEITEDECRHILSSNLVVRYKCDWNGHIEVIHPYINSTCVSTGLTEGKYCSACGKTLTVQNIIPINSDNHVNIVTDSGKTATCTSTGLTEGKHCSACGKITVPQEVIPATGLHNYVLTANTEECSVCGHILRKFGIWRHEGVTPMSEARGYLAATTVGNYALFGGGKNSSSTSSTVDAYNTSLTISTAEPLSIARRNLAATTVGNYALFGGGDDTTSYSNSKKPTAVDAYNASLTKSMPAALSVGRDYLAATTIGSYALFGGGKNLAEKETVDAYNASLTKSIPTVLSEARYYLAATSIGNYALFAGGYESTTAAVANVDAYNSSLTRSIPTALSVRKQELAATSIGNYALFAGGRNNDSSTDTTLVDAYNTSLTRSTPATISASSASRYSLAATTIGNYAMFAGGRGGLKYVDIYNESLTNVSSSSTYLTTSRADFAATSIGNYALFGGGYYTQALASVEAYVYIPE